MKRRTVEYFVGPNLYSRRVLVRLELEPEGLDSLAPEEVQRRLDAHWPDGSRWQAMANTLLERTEADGALQLGTAVGLIANFALNMRANPEFRYWHESAADPQSRDEVTTVYIEAELPLPALHSTQFAFELAQLLFTETPLREDKSVEEDIQYALRRLAWRRREKEYNNITRLLTDAARARGVPVNQYFQDSPVAVLGQGCHRRRMTECFGDTTSVIANMIARDKAFTSGLLINVGVPVPKQRSVRTQAELDKAIEEIGYPLVIKGRTGSKGDSVTTNIRSREAVDEAVKKARAAGQEVLVENHVEGEDFRITVIDGKLIAAARRVPAHVIGDGRQTIAELIAEENRRREAWDSPYASWIQHLVLDDDMRAVLERQSLTPESVPDEGAHIALRAAGNFSLGGLAEDVTDQIHPSVVATIERAARAVGLDMAGVDLLTPDITAPIDSVRCAVNEVNNYPSPRAHYITPTPPRDVAGAIIDYLFPDAHRGRIPIVAVLAEQAPEVAARLRGCFAGAGLAAASASRDGLYLGDEMLCPARDLAARDTATILQDPAVEAAIFQVWPKSVFSNGLAWEACDTAVIDGSAFAEQGDMEALASLLASLADKALVLDGTSPAACRILGERRRGQRVFWVGGPDQRYKMLPWLAEGDRTLIWEPEQGQAVLKGIGQTEPVTFDLPEGAQSKELPKVQLLAVAAALSLGLDESAIASGLQSTPLGETLQRAAV